MFTYIYIPGVVMSNYSFGIAIHVLAYCISKLLVAWRAVTTCQAHEAATII